MNGFPLARKFILESPTDYWLNTMHTVFSMIRLFGGGVQTAYAVQTCFAIAAILLLLAMWSRRPLSLAVRGPSLCAAMLLASPYSFVYDEVLLAIPIVLLAQEGIKKGFLPFEKIFLFALWLLPFQFSDAGEHYLFPLTLTPPMLIGLLFFCQRRMLREISNTASVRSEPVMTEYQ